MSELTQALLQAKWSDGSTVDIPIQFNPAEFTLTKGVQTAEINLPGLDSPLLQFVRGQPETLQVDLFFDTTDWGMGDDAKSVTEKTDCVYSLVKIEPDGHAPPICIFKWGPSFPGGDHILTKTGSQSRYAFTCIVESVRQRFTLFTPKGVPLRAVLTLSLKEYKPLEQQLQQLNLNSPDRTQSHVVQRGETLSRIAGVHYKQPVAWRAIAQANGIEDPRRLAPGTFLRIPPAS